MLLPRNTNPAYSTYYYGSVVLNAMSELKGKSIEFIDLFQVVNKHKKMSMQSFVLTLDWLYLIRAVEFNANGNLQMHDKNKYKPKYFFINSIKISSDVKEFTAIDVEQEILAMTHRKPKSTSNSRSEHDSRSMSSESDSRSVNSEAGKDFNLHSGDVLEVS